MKMADLDAMTRMIETLTTQLKEKEKQIEISQKRELESDLKCLKKDKQIAELEAKVVEAINSPDWLAMKVAADLKDENASLKAEVERLNKYAIAEAIKNDLGRIATLENKIEKSMKIAKEDKLCGENCRVVKALEG